jgi:hypothetical protein
METFYWMVAERMSEDTGIVLLLILIPLIFHIYNTDFRIRALENKLGGEKDEKINS